MVIRISVKPAVTKSVVHLLLEHDIQFQFDSRHNSFIIYDVTQWLLMTDSDVYSESFNVVYLPKFIHKDNILELCIINS